MGWGNSNARKKYDGIGWGNSSVNPLIKSKEDAPAVKDCLQSSDSQSPEGKELESEKNKKGQH